MHLQNQHTEGDDSEKHAISIDVSPSSSPPIKIKDTEEKDKIEIDFHPPNFSCCVCNKSCLQRLELETHMKTHKGNSHTCCDCAKTFEFKENLEKHVRIHTSRIKNKELEVEMMEVEIDANDMVIKMLENRVEQLETEFINANKREEEYEKEIQRLKCFKEKSLPENKRKHIPKHLESVKRKTFTPS